MKRTRTAVILSTAALALAVFAKPQTSPDQVKISPRNELSKSEVAFYCGDPQTRGDAAPQSAFDKVAAILAENIAPPPLRNHNQVRQVLDGIHAHYCR